MNLNLLYFTSLLSPTIGALVLLLATFTHAQTSHFLFDPNGNLLAQLGNINAPPQITGQPQNQIVGPGETASFFVVATGELPLTFQWRFNGADIGGATGEALLLENVSTNSEGEYRLVLTNPSGSVTSAPAFLMIDGDGDGMGDSWELTYFPDLDGNATSDADGDGSSNLNEFLNDTNPTNSASARFRLLVIRDGGSVIKTLDQASYTNGESVTLTAIASPGGEPFHAWLGDIVTRSNPVTLVMTNDMTVYARFTPIVFTWTNTTSGDWDVATNWTPGLVPGSNDSPVIASAVTVSLNTAADCADFTLGSATTGPTLTGSGLLTVRGAFVWAGGTLSGSGRTVVQAGAILEIANPIATTVSLSTRTLENRGTVLWSGAGNLGMSGSVISNRPGALFHAQNASSIAFVAGSPRFDNAGTFRKFASGGTLIVENGVTFNNSGTVEIQAGTLRLGGGGVATGTFDVPATASVEWASGAFTLNAGAQLNGAGLYRIGATVTANTNVIVENLNLIGGTLGGTGTTTISSVMNWTGGSMSGSGRTIIPPDATLNVSNNVSGVSLTGRVLENGGTLLWTGSQSIGLDFGGIITNRAGALFEIQSAASFGSIFAGNRIDNAGTFRKSVNAGTTTVPFSFNNSGVVEIQTGTLNLSGGGTSSGSFSVPAETTLTLSGTHSIGASSSVSGGGQLTVGGGTATLAGLVNVSGSNTFSGGAANLTGHYICTNNTLTIAGGTANFDGTGIVEPAVVNLNSGTLAGSNLVAVGSLMNWTGGIMSGSGRTIIQPGATLNLAVPNVVDLVGRTLENAGTALWTGPGAIELVTAVITNRAGALFHVQNAAPFQSFGVNRFDNAGTFRKSDNPGTTIVGSGLTFNNYGTVDLRSGILAANGGYTSTSDALLNCALGGTTAGTNHGQLQVAGTVTLNGALSVGFVNGFLPTTNDSFAVVTAGTRNGTFANFHFPSNAVTMQLSNTPNSVIVSVGGLVVPELVLFPPVLTSSNVTLCWVADSNKTYQLEYTFDPGMINWDIVPGEVTTSSNKACQIEALTLTNRFYRVRVLP